MRIRNLIPTGGAHTPPGGRNAGRSSRNRSPNRDCWNWGISESQRLCARSPVRSCHFPEQAACHLNSLTHSHFCLWIWSTRHGYPPRKAGHFTGADFPLQPDGTLKSPSRPCASPKGAAKSALTGACAWCMREVTVTAALARLARTVSMGGPRDAQARARVSVRLASAAGGSCTAALALLPPPSPSASLYAVGA